MTGKFEDVSESVFQHENVSRRGSIQEIVNFINTDRKGCDDDDVVAHGSGDLGLSIDRPTPTRNSHMKEKQTASTICTSGGGTFRVGFKSCSPRRISMSSHLHIASQVAPKMTSCHMFILRIV